MGACRKAMIVGFVLNRPRFVRKGQVRDTSGSPGKAIRDDLSTRDVENTVAGALGSDAALPKSTVPDICQDIRGGYNAWRGRGLSGVSLDCLSWTCTRTRRPNRFLAARSIKAGGKPAFTGLEAAPGLAAAGHIRRRRRPGLRGRARPGPLTEAEVPRSQIPQRPL